jgi:hypothetical protein
LKNASDYITVIAISFIQGQAGHGASEVMDTGTPMPNIQGGYNGMVLHIPTSTATTILRHDLLTIL